MISTFLVCFLLTTLHFSPPFLARVLSRPLYRTGCLPDAYLCVRRRVFAVRSCQTPLSDQPGFIGSLRLEGRGIADLWAFCSFMSSTFIPDFFMSFYFYQEFFFQFLFLGLLPFSIIWLVAKMWYLKLSLWKYGLTVGSNHWPSA